MWEESLTIKQPFGISVFGSALIKTSPDIVSIQASVNRTEEKPDAAFSKARKAARAVTDFLRHSGIDDFGMSRMTLGPEFEFSAGKKRFVGYTAKISFRVVLKVLDKAEEIVSGLVDAGASEIGSMEFQTSVLKDVRAKARQLAIAAAQEKARVYASAAGVSVGEVIHIQDVSPQILQQRTGMAMNQFHVEFQKHAFDSDVERQVLDPGALDVGAVVLVGFRLAPATT
jgi:uncharacterized protein